MSDSRIPSLFRCSVSERINELQQRGWLSAIDAKALREGRHVITPHAADKMIENVIATFGLPLAIAPNFTVNGRDYVVPLVVEEPSIVAALSNAARLARSTGGFDAACDESLLIGQIHLSDVTDVVAACAAINGAKKELLAAANTLNPRLSARGGGVRDIEVRVLQLDGDRQTIAVHLLVDTCDAMGANLVNTLCEALAPEVAAHCEGRVGMRILSNLADRSLATASVRIRLNDLDRSKQVAVSVRDAIVLANDIALADPYRAATHNKGILNGIDPLAIATGNDWRAIEAGVHAFAAGSGQYRALTRWSVGEVGDLLGEICLPLKAGIVGGARDVNPAAALGLRICAVESARELAELMAAVGLAQNFAALRALAGSGIQRGHMRLHARSVAASVGVPDELLEDVAAELAASGDVKAGKAREILTQKQACDESYIADCSTASGKVILLGEHAAVYGKHALALPITNAVSAVVRIDRKTTASILDWGIRRSLDLSGDDLSGIDAMIALIAKELDVPSHGFALTVRSLLPQAMGLGSSAAIAVAVIRAFNTTFEIGLVDERVSAIAFECEKLAHGTPSGVDNAVATFASPMLFRRSNELEVTPLSLTCTPPVLIAFSSAPGSTIEQVAGVRERSKRHNDRYDALFAEIDVLTLQGAKALQHGDYHELGALMNICHGLLNAIEVSTPELEHMVSIARSNGAVGAKLTGAGGGGSIVALCPESTADVDSALRGAGYKTMRLQDE